MLKAWQGSLVLFVVLLFSEPLRAQSDFYHLPYLQNPSPDAMTVIWFSHSADAGKLSFRKKGSWKRFSLVSEPSEASTLIYSTWEASEFLNSDAPPVPFRHRIRIADLQPGTTYSYTVHQGGSKHQSSFTTAPAGDRAVRFIVYADSETEPESTGKHARWDDPVTGQSRKYLIDQTNGYSNNLEVIQSRDPDLILIAGDLVQHGGEQRDWNEFWRHNTNTDGSISLASHTPILAAVGNHEYFEGTALDQYNQPGSERAVSKYLTYFESPENHSPNPNQNGRFYQLDYGPASLLVVDLCNNTPGNSNEDTNYFLSGENEQGGGNAPDFGPHSYQYKWIEEKLAAAQRNKVFSFVVFHHAPYSSGPHGLPAGDQQGFDKQSGRPGRLLTPLFMRYGVDAVFNGHDEMWERSELTGVEVDPDGSEKQHRIQFYDVGIGGDGLRAPVKGLENPQQKFLVHNDVPEVWENNVLLDGGKHYGHLEIDIKMIDDKNWEAILKPVYIFPLLDADGKSFSDYERRLYDDQVKLIRSKNDPEKGVQ